MWWRRQIDERNVRDQMRKLMEPLVLEIGADRVPAGLLDEMCSICTTGGRRAARAHLTAVRASLLPRNLANVALAARITTYLGVAVVSMSYALDCSLSAAAVLVAIALTPLPATLLWERYRRRRLGGAKLG